MPSESLLSDNDIESASYFIIEGDKSETHYALGFLPRCPGNAILHYVLPNGRDVATPPTPADQIKGEVIIGWCNSIRAQDSADREGDAEENEALRQKRIREEDRLAVSAGYASHNDMLEQLGGTSLDVTSSEPGQELTAGGIALPPGTTLPSGGPETLAASSATSADVKGTTQPQPAPGASIVERLQAELDAAHDQLDEIMLSAERVQAEIDAMDRAIEALS